MRILVLHGPNLNLLGVREEAHYGSMSLSEINEEILTCAKENGADVTTFQSNSEGVLVDSIQKAKSSGVDAIVINAAAYTHTSIAIRDALLAVKIPAVEVHLSNIYRREKFRHHSLLSDVVVAQISGFGSQSYILGMLGIMNHLEKNSERKGQTL